MLLVAESSRRSGLVRQSRSTTAYSVPAHSDSCCVVPGSTEFTAFPVAFLVGLVVWLHLEEHPLFFADLLEPFAGE